ncbi:MAG: Mur ligase family protein [Candidatus Shapirobacteria bacterium]|nr:Mur ligase family protein [Candidatus Shapirobacteria bacterium]
MKTKNLIYLAQLEEYNSNAIKKWLKNNPGKTVVEIKHHLKLTPKTCLIYFLTSLFSLFSNNQKALFLTLNLLTPFDNFFKNILIKSATFKFKIFNKKTTVIAITGSWGKTTTKEALYAILKTTPHVFYTPSNHNTLLSIAKQVLFLPVSAKIFICEIGAYQPDDIKKVCQIIKPQIGILTAIGPMHLERFGSLENILKTKMELAESLPKNGIFWAPKNLISQIKKFSLPQNTNYFTDYSQIYFSLAFNFNISQKDVQKILNNFSPVEHRQQLITNGPITIIDDTYNSNPAGFESALKKLKSIKSDQKILITPGMIELGPMQFSENARLATMAGKICNHIIIVGQTNKEAWLSGLKNTPAKIHLIQNLSETDNLLPSIYQGTSAVLFENDLGDQYF